MEMRGFSRYWHLLLGWATPAIATVSSVWTAANAGVSSAPGPTAQLSDDRKIQPVTFSIPNRVDGPEQFAGHRSHASHSSHRSHYSGSGGSYPSTPLPSNSGTDSSNPTDPATQAKPDTTTDQGTIVAMRVQLELKRRGYYSGQIDGVMGTATKMALTKFQQAQGLPATGTMDNATLARLGITP